MFANKSLTPKFFFLRLLSIVALITVLFAVMGVMFSIINITVQDPVPNYYDSYYYESAGYKQNLRTALSFLIVMFPVYLASLLTLQKWYKDEKELKKMLAPKWLSYGSLFISSLVILFSLVALLNKLFNGEWSLRFFLKLLTLVVLSGGVLAYHQWFIKKNE